jgi:3-hydroxyacyl-[acyl-carrier-protein] dehydratase
MEFGKRLQDDHLLVSAVFRFPSTFAGFSGHFPDRPVLPAIIQLATVRHLAQTALERPLAPADYGKTKFRGIISADERILFTLKIREAGDGWKGDFVLTRTDGEVVANGSCTFQNRQQANDGTG